MSSIHSPFGAATTARIRHPYCPPSPAATEHRGPLLPQSGSVGSSHRAEGHRSQASAGSLVAANGGGSLPSAAHSSSTSCLGKLFEGDIDTNSSAPGGTASSQYFWHGGFNASSTVLDGHMPKSMSQKTPRSTYAKNIAASYALADTYSSYFSGQASSCDLDSAWRILEAEHLDVLAHSFVNPQRLFPQLECPAQAVVGDPGDLQLSSPAAGLMPCDPRPAHQDERDPALSRADCPLLIHSTDGVQHIEPRLLLHSGSSANLPMTRQRPGCSSSEQANARWSDDAASTVSPWSRDAEGSPDPAHASQIGYYGVFDQCSDISTSALEGSDSEAVIQPGRRRLPDASHRLINNVDPAEDRPATPRPQPAHLSCSGSGIKQPTATGNRKRKGSKPERRDKVKSGMKTKRKLRSRSSITVKRGRPSAPSRVTVAETRPGISNARSDSRVSPTDSFPRMRQIYMTRHRRTQLQRDLDVSDDAELAAWMGLSHSHANTTIPGACSSHQTQDQPHMRSETEPAQTSLRKTADGPSCNRSDIVAQQDDPASPETIGPSSKPPTSPKFAEQSVSPVAPAGEDASPSDPTTTASRRQFPRSFPIMENFPGFYQRYKVSSSLPEDVREVILAGSEQDAELREVAKRAVRQFSAFNAPRSLLDLYTPRFCRGVAMSKEGLCPICYEEGVVKFFKTKISAFNYHMQYAHGISAATGLPFTPPVAFRTRERVRAPLREKTEILQGKCHVCKKFVDIEGVKLGSVKVPEIYWWKHAQACHRSSAPPSGVGGYFIEDAYYARVKAYIDQQAVREEAP